MRQRFASQDGIAVPTALWVTVILLLLATAATGVAVAGLSQATRDRHAKRALEAADAGMDAALYRMNKTVVSSNLTGLLGQSGLTAAALRELGCLDADVSSIVVIASGEWCVDTTGVAEGLGDTATYSYRVKSGLTVAVGTLPAEVRSVLTGGTTNVVRRTIVSTGTSGGVSRRVLSVFLLSLNSSGGSLALWSPATWVECPPTYTGSPDSGCPDTNLTP